MLRLEISTIYTTCTSDQGDLVLYDMTVWLGIPCLNGAIIDVIAW